MELLDHIALGLSTAASLDNLFYCFVGALIGTFVKRRCVKKQTSFKKNSEKSLRKSLNLQKDFHQ